MPDHGARARDAHRGVPGESIKREVLRRSGQKMERTFCPPGRRDSGTHEIAQELENQMLTVMSLVTARLNRQEVQLQRRTDEFGRLIEDNGLLGAVIKQLAKHTVWLTGDIVPPRNTEIPGSTVHKVMESLAKEIDRTAFKEKLQDTKASIDFSMTDVSKLTDTVGGPNIAGNRLCQTQSGSLEALIHTNDVVGKAGGTFLGTPVASDISELAMVKTSVLARFS